MVRGLNQRKKSSPKFLANGRVELFDQYWRWVAVLMLAPQEPGTHHRWAGELTEPNGA